MTLSYGGTERKDLQLVPKVMAIAVSSRSSDQNSGTSQNSAFPHLRPPVCFSFPNCLFFPLI